MNRDQLNAQLSAEFGGPAIDAWPTVPGAKLRPHKGGDGGAGAARQQEEDRQARIKKSVDAINAIFNGQSVTQGTDRATSFDPNATYYNEDGTQYIAPTKSWTEHVGGAQFGDGSADGGPTYWVGGQDVQRSGVDMDAVSKLLSEGKLFTSRSTTQPVNTNRTELYDQQKQAVTDLNRREVDRQHTEAERMNRFGLARSGLLGGSADVDSNADLQRRTNEGIMQATALGDQAAADLRTSDERTRQGLISMAQSGIDTGTAQQTALAGLNANSQAAAGARGGATIGNLFSDLSNAYLQNQINAGRTAGAVPGQQWYGVSAPQQTYGGSTTR